MKTRKYRNCHILVSAYELEAKPILLPSITFGEIVYILTDQYLRHRAKARDRHNTEVERLHSARSATITRRAIRDIQTGVSYFHA